MDPGQPAWSGSATMVVGDASSVAKVGPVFAQTLTATTWVPEVGDRLVLGLRLASLATT